MRRIATMLGVVILCQGPSLLSQVPHPLSFFPHHNGDIWEYIDPNIPGPYEQNMITLDTLIGEGRYLILMSLFGKNVLDTNKFTLKRTFNNVDTLLQYRLGAIQGETWVQYRYAGRTFLGRVASVFQTILFGQLVTVKQINYTDSASGLLLDTDYLASGFGLIGQDNDSMPYRRIRGAIINGVQYGTVTVSVPVPVSTLPTRAKLFQNFPNPFNSETMIKFELPSSRHVELSILDLLGRRITTLLDEHRYPGPHHVRFKAEGLASGVYIYRLETESQTISKRMMLVR